MLFGKYVIDKTIEEHVTEIAAWANDPQTLIFLDTNILTYLYKLHGDARQEFFQWAGDIAASSRLAIPAWVASEYLSRVTSKALDSYTPKSKEASQATKLLNGLLETAALFVDGSSLSRIGFSGDRAAFIDGFRTAIAELARYTCAFSQDFDSGVVHQQIEANLSSAILDSDLAALCARATKEANGRIEHRIPPGFRDEGKSENRLGDLIIWYEILQKSASKAAEFQRVLFVSRDEKSDWVYSPAKRIEIVRGLRKQVSNTNPEIKLADPRLVVEFAGLTGHRNFAISNLPALVEGLSKCRPADFTHLAAAIQINIQELTPVVPPAGQENSTEAATISDAASANRPSEPPLIPVEVQQKLEGSTTELGDGDLPARDVPFQSAHPRLHYDIDALQDSQYQADAPSAINVIIRALRSHNWYTQNPAVVKIRTVQSEQFSPSSWFVLGRNLYQAACGNSQKAMELLETLDAQLRQFPPATAQHLLAGMLFEIYFDSHGQFRRTAKFSCADKPLSLATEDTYAEALEFILFHLRDHSAQLKYLPGDRDRKIILIASELVAQAAQGATEPHPGAHPRPTRELRSVKLDGVELMRNVVHVLENAWERLLFRVTLSPDRIRERISEELGIPKWALAIETHPPIRTDIELAIPAGVALHPKQALPASLGDSEFA